MAELILVRSMRELIDRLRYRFVLWRRERREDLFGAPGGDPYEEARDTSHYHDPRNVAIITESTPRFVVRFAIVLFGGIAILAVIDCLVAVLWPPARHAADIIVVVLVAVWTIGIGFTMLDMCKARRMQRNKPREEI